MTTEEKGALHALAVNVGQLVTIVADLKKENETLTSKVTALEGGGKEQQNAVATDADIDAVFRNMKI